MSWMIVSDSSCDIRELDHLAPDVMFSVAPFKIMIGEKEYVDLPSLNVQEMMRAMTEYHGVSTSACPSPEEWAAYYRQADQVIALTISSNLSGSYNAAMAARQMVLEENPSKRIFVLDTLSNAGALAEAARLANRMIGEGKAFEEICDALKAYNDAGHILFTFSSFENLAKNGRVSRMTGLFADCLHIRVLGRRTLRGTIEFFYKTRGESKVQARMISEMEKTGFDGSRAVMISHCMNPEGAGRLRAEICARWPRATVRVVPCAGLCSFYAQDKGMILTY